MNRLFIELYLDEDVDVLVADLIRARGFMVITAREAGQLEESDSMQLEYAVARHKTLVTHNRLDFEALAQAYFEAGETHYGVILAFRRPPGEIARRLLLILNHLTFDEIRNQVRYV